MLGSSLVLRALGLFVVIAAGIGIAMLVSRAHVLDAESKAFVDNAVPAIAASLSGDQLLDRATPGLRARIQSEDLTTLADLSSHLGRFAQYLGATGEVSRVSLAGFGGSMSASYSAKASFISGIATFRLTLVDLDGRWMISDYHIDAIMLDPPGADILQSRPIVHGP